MVMKLGMYSKEEVRDIVRAKWDELTSGSEQQPAPAQTTVSPNVLDRSTRTRRYNL